MTVVEFPIRRPDPVGTWDAADRQVIAGLCEAGMAAGAISEWGTGVTERDDPQAYLIGPAPDHDCILCFSRVGQLYILEDGRGQLIGESKRLAQLAERARALLARRRHSIAVRAMAAWYAARELFEEKLEPLMAEPAELLSHVAPPLAALV
jgi:GNAT superfamily N-acetyltransferase